MKFPIDTDVVSQDTKPLPNRAALRWLQRVRREDIGLSVMTIQEVRAGIELMPAGAKRRTVERWLLTDLIEGFAGRVLPVEIAIADECGRLVVVARRLGHTPDLGDTLIAATANVAALKLATLNRKRFERLGVELVEF